MNSPLDKTRVLAHYQGMLAEARAVEKSVPNCVACNQPMDSEDCDRAEHWLPRLVSDVTWAIRKRMEEERS